MAGWIFLTVFIFCHEAAALMFRPDQFKDMTETCRKNNGKPVRFILNEDNPAMYVSVDPAHPTLMALQRMERARLYNRLTMDYKGRVMLQQDTVAEDNRRAAFLALANSVNLATQGGSNEGILLTQPEPKTSNNTFDCVLHFETQLPIGDKQAEKYDALSLIIVEFDHSERRPSIPAAPSPPSPASSSTPQPPPPPLLPLSADHPYPSLDLVTFGHDGYMRRRVTKKAQYADRMWPGHHNPPNFLLSGQLSGFDSIDYRTKVDPQHLVKPEQLHSTFDKPAFITVNLTNWTIGSHVYLVVTSYKFLRRGERCQDHKEFDCATPNFLGASNDHMCMNINLACDGLPNCGQDFLPNQDENCFKIHWSSVLLSLVSYILLAITLLLCLSCFARVLIQWSVRSSLAELRGMNSPTGSFRSSTRLFSFLGTTFTGRWERPPPTYDEAMKHVNPDLAGMPPSRSHDPPPYTETGSGNGCSSQRSTLYVGTSPTAASMMDESLPPPEYQSQEDINRIHLELPRTTAIVLADDEPATSSRRSHHHHSNAAAGSGGRRSHHRRHHSRHTTADVSASRSSEHSSKGETNSSSSIPDTAVHVMRPVDRPELAGTRPVVAASSGEDHHLCAYANNIAQ